MNTTIKLKNIQQILEPLGIFYSSLGFSGIWSSCVYGVLKLNDESSVLASLLESGKKVDGGRNKVEKTEEGVRIQN